MTRDDIIRMAQECGLIGMRPHRWRRKNTLTILVCFATLVADAEREACAKVCDDEATIEGIAQRCAAAIRARGEK